MESRSRKVWPSLAYDGDGVRARYATGTAAVVDDHRLAQHLAQQVEQSGVARVSSA